VAKKDWSLPTYLGTPKLARFMAGFVNGGEEDAELAWCKARLGLKAGRAVS
jgi:hypothetical protein